MASVVVSVEPPWRPRRLSVVVSCTTVGRP